MFNKERKAVENATDVVRDANTTALLVAGLAVAIAVVAIVLVVANVKGLV